MSGDLIEQLIQYFSKSPYKEDFVRAKEMYTKTLGTMVEEHPYFDTWISGFFEWYLIDYKMVKFGVPPVYLFQRIFVEQLKPEDMEFLQNMEISNLELLEILSVSGQKIRAQNMFDKSMLDFESHENTALLKKGDFLVTRILRKPKKTNSFGVVWHLSSEIAPIVVKKMEQIRTPHDQELFLYELMRKKSQSEVYSHVPLDQIFSWKTDGNSPRVEK